MLERGKGKQQITFGSKALWLHQTSPKSVILHISHRFVFASIKGPMDAVFGNYHTKTLARR